MTAETQIAYALNQHQLCCEYLNIPQRYDMEGGTLLETLIALEKDRDEWKEEANLREKQADVWKHEIKVLRDELAKADEVLRSNISTFLDLREQVEEARACAVELRESLCRPEWAKPIVFPWENAGTSLDSENS